MKVHPSPLPTELELSGPTGDAVAIHWAEPPNSSHRWRITLVAQGDEGAHVLGETITVPPVLGSPPSRIAVIAYCPGILRWKARIAYVDSVTDPPTPTGRPEVDATLSSRDCCASTALGFHPLDVLGTDRRETFVSEGLSSPGDIFSGSNTLPMTSGTIYTYRGNQRRKRAIVRNAGSAPDSRIEITGRLPFFGGPFFGDHYLLEVGATLEITTQRDLFLRCSGSGSPAASFVSTYEELYE